MDKEEALKFLKEQSKAWIYHVTTTHKDLENGYKKVDEAVELLTQN